MDINQVLEGTLSPGMCLATLAPLSQLQPD